MKNYIYIAGLYHIITGKEISSDYNVGITDNLNKTEISFNNTSIMKYKILKSWELSDNMKKENIEEIISDELSKYKCVVENWYNIDFYSLCEKIKSTFNVVKKATNGEYFIKEINLKEINKKRAEYSNLDITIGGVKIGGKTAKDKYTNLFNYIAENNIITLDKINQNFGNILKKNKKELIGNHKCSSFIYGYHLECYNGTYVKKKNLDRINKKFKLGIVCKVIDPN